MVLRCNLCGVEKHTTDFSNVKVNGKIYKRKTCIKCYNDIYREKTRKRKSLIKSKAQIKREQVAEQIKLRESVIAPIRKFVYHMRLKDGFSMIDCYKLIHYYLIINGDKCYYNDNLTIEDELYIYWDKLNKWYEKEKEKKIRQTKNSLDPQIH
jgi:hypothetical protein